ncbi:MAG: hypothetical protein LBT87_08385 [Treponema sp.]|jgi:hypothetical protein|nr:hypothetical protein [Treponema sp.]
MDITINGKAADITLEEEKTLGEVLAGLDAWLQDSGYRFSGLEVDGEKVDSRSLECFFNREVAKIGVLNLSTSSWAELAAEALSDLYGKTEKFQDCSFGERAALKQNWEQSPGGCFLSEHMRDLYTLADGSFAGHGPGPQDLRKIIQERLKELEDPRREIAASGPLVEAVAARLEDLPLDIQTGKDGRAAETVQLFSSVAGKLLRLLGLLKLEGHSPEILTVDGVPIFEYVGEFESILQDLAAAYEARDAVLVGDLAEYELAPRLLKFHSAFSPAT